MNWREAAQHRLFFVQRLLGKVQAEMASEAYEKLGFADLAPDDALLQPPQEKFCRSCGEPSLPGSNYCPNCGSPSKKLSAPDSRAAESAAVIPLPAAPALAGRLNVAGVTAEIYEGGEVVILMPCAVSMTVRRLGSEMLGDYETRLAPLENPDARKAAAPTSFMQGD